MPHYPHAQSDNRTLTRATTRPTATTHSRRKFPPETSVRPATAAPGRGGGVGNRETPKGPATGLTLAQGASGSELSGFFSETEPS